MAEQSGFFNSNIVDGEYDRVYLAESFANYFANFIGNGVFGGKLSDLAVVQSLNSSMKVEVLPGVGWINGYWYENTSNLSFNISVADGVLNRIDIIVLQWNKSSRSINVIVKKGVSASTPVAPSLQRDADIYELKLAEVYIKAGSTGIIQTDIKDTRADTNACGFVTGLIKQLDTTEFNDKLNQFLRELAWKNAEEIDGIIDRLKDVVEDESALAGLSLEVYDTINKIALINQTLGYNKKNMIPYPYVNTSRTANGIKWIDVGDGTITANGVATGNSYFTVYKGKAFAKGKYIISSNADINGKHFIYIRFVDRYTSVEASPAVYGYNNVPFEITDEYVDEYDLLIGLYIVGGSNLSNVVFKPMLRRAEITDGTWEPYTPDIKEILQEIIQENKELSENVEALLLKKTFKKSISFSKINTWTVCSFDNIEIPPGYEIISAKVKASLGGIMATSPSFDSATGANVYLCTSLDALISRSIDVELTLYYGNENLINNFEIVEEEGEGEVVG